MVRCMRSFLCWTGNGSDSSSDRRIIRSLPREKPWLRNDSSSWLVVTRFIVCCCFGTWWLLELRPVTSFVPTIEVDTPDWTIDSHVGTCCHCCCRCGGGCTCCSDNGVVSPADNATGAPSLARSSLSMHQVIRTHLCLVHIRSPSSPTLQFHCHHRSTGSWWYWLMPDDTAQPIHHSTSVNRAISASFTISFPFLTSSPHSSLEMFFMLIRGTSCPSPVPFNCPYSQVDQCHLYLAISWLTLVQRQLLAYDRYVREKEVWVRFVLEPLSTNGWSNRRPWRIEGRKLVLNQLFLEGSIGIQSDKRWMVEWQTTSHAKNFT